MEEKVKSRLIELQLGDVAWISRKNGKVEIMEEVNMGHIESVPSWVFVLFSSLFYRINHDDSWREEFLQWQELNQDMIMKQGTGTRIERRNV